ncbi:MAG: filamentous hemagglutinin N-terminal domain-containing protein [Cyanobacteria bacterium P01_H01_bin.119]
MRPQYFHIKGGLQITVLGSAASLALALPSFSNPITLEAGSATQVTQTGSEYTIIGGDLSADGQNLFHSFEAFGLSQAQIANFLTNPDVQAVLERINEGSASHIDGLLQVTGSSADLYLINPSGILFGPHAALNLAESFTAVTANGSTDSPAAAAIAVPISTP